MIGLDSYSSYVFNYLDPILIYISFESTAYLKFETCSMFPPAFVARSFQDHC